MGSGEDVFVGRSEQEDEQGLRTVARELGGVHLRGDDKAHGETIGSLMRLFRRFLRNCPKTSIGSNLEPQKSTKEGEEALFRCSGGPKWRLQRGCSRPFSDSFSRHLGE